MSNESLFGLNQPSPPTYQPQFSLWVRQLLTVLLILGAILLLTLIAPVLPMLTIAFLLAFVMFLPSRSIARNTPIPYPLAVIILYLVLISALVVGMLVIIPTLTSAARSLATTLENGYVQFTTNLAAYNPEDAVFDVLGTRVDLSDLASTLKTTLVQTTEAAAVAAAAAAEGSTSVPNAPVEGLPPSLVENGASTSGGIRVPQGELGTLINQFLSLFGSVTQTLTIAIGSVTGFVVSLLLAVFISFLVLLDIPHTHSAIASRIPPAYQREFALLVQRMVRVWNGFFRGQVLIGIMIGVLTWVQLSAMGISSAVILAVITGVISLIPTIGGIIALFPLALVPLISGSTVFDQLPYGVVSLLVVGVNLTMNQVIWNFLAPKILGDALDLPLPLIIVGVFIGAAAGGVLGAFLVAPIMATLRVLVSYLWHKINLEDPYPGEEAPFEWGSSLFDRESRLKRWITRLRERGTISQPDPAHST